MSLYNVNYQPDIFMFWAILSTRGPKNVDKIIFLHEQTFLGSGGMILYHHPSTTLIFGVIAGHFIAKTVHQGVQNAQPNTPNRKYSSSLRPDNNL